MFKDLFMTFTMPAPSLAVAALLGFLLWAAPEWAVASGDQNAVPVPKARKNNLAPLAHGEKAAATHAPFESGDCGICHKNADPKNPGPITAAGNGLCFGCHEDMSQILARKSVHVAAKESCVSCHNPHNSKEPRLLVEEAGALCLSCHQKIKILALQAPVKHGALATGAKCANCHNPHGAGVEHLLIQLPMNLCLNCHGKDDVVDHQGKKLANMRKLLDENPERHGPVAAEDCSACHNPHGHQNFRLLNYEYPAAFYSPYDPKLYALCFDCHDQRMVAEPETTTQTEFRNGSRNLHYVHVNKADRGRTCRACHEVHAAKQKHQIRDSVPYGAKGWRLTLNYAKTPTGGSCEKTCHATKSYDNSKASVAKTKNE